MKCRRFWTVGVMVLVLAGTIGCSKSSAPSATFKGGNLEKIVPPGAPGLPPQKAKK